MSHVDIFGAKTVYDEAAARYTSLARDHFGPAVKHLLDLANLSAGQTVLDVACGPGLIALGAARRVGPAGRAIGVDISDGMLAEAQRAAQSAGVRNVRFYTGDLNDLPFPPAAFDKVLIGFAVFMARDHSTAVADLWEIVKPGGTLAISTFAQDHWAPVYDVYLDAVRRHSHVDLDPLLLAQQIDQPDALSTIFHDARVPDVTVSYEPNTIALSGPDEFWRIIAATGSNRIDRELSPEAAARVREEVNTYIAAEAITSLDLGVNYAVAHKAV